MSKKILVTGGAGFIGSALVRHLIAATPWTMINADKLTYAGNLDSLAEVMDSPAHVFEQTDIRDAQAVAALFEKHRPDAVMHLAAESHVDRSIAGPAEFVQTNIVGTSNLLEAARAFQSRLPGEKKEQFRFLHVSTDEVYGKGENIRDWLYVEDHVRALHTVLERGWCSIRKQCSKFNIQR